MRFLLIGKLAYSHLVFPPKHTLAWTQMVYLSSWQITSSYLNTKCLKQCRNQPFSPSVISAVDTWPLVRARCNKALSNTEFSSWPGWSTSCTGHSSFPPAGLRAHLSWLVQGSAAPCAARLLASDPYPAGVCIHWAPAGRSSHYPDTRLLCRAQQTGGGMEKKDKHNCTVKVFKVFWHYKRFNSIGRCSYTLFYYAGVLAVTCPGVRALTGWESEIHTEPFMLSVTVQGTGKHNKAVFSCSVNNKLFISVQVLIASNSLSGIWWMKRKWHSIIWVLASSGGGSTVTQWKRSVPTVSRKRAGWLAVGALSATKLRDKATANIGHDSNLATP